MRSGRSRFEGAWRFRIVDRTSVQSARSPQACKGKASRHGRWAEPTARTSRNWRAISFSDRRCRQRDRLYVLAEMDGMIRLCASNAATGRLEWSLDLAQPEAAIAADPVRRMAGASPSLADGILICPTSAGAVAAVDPTTRSLLWGFQYPLGKDTVENVRRGILRQGGRIKHSAVNRTVADASAVLAAGRTLLLPVESEQLFCLDSAERQIALVVPPRGDAFHRGRGGRQSHLGRRTGALCAESANRQIGLARRAHRNSREGALRRTRHSGRKLLLSPQLHGTNW